MIRIAFIAAVVFGATALAQDSTNETPPPPLVDAPVKESDAPKKEEPPTPPPPGAHLPGGNQTGYPYSPYGAPQGQQQPPPEYGLIATEYLFGVLTAAPIVLLPYLFFLRPNLQARAAGAIDADQAMFVNILFIILFSSVPVAVAQTEIGLANGSRYYYVESWPAYLSGLVAQAAVVGLYFLVNPASSLAEPILLGGSILFVPAVETAAINFMKTPKGGGGSFGLLNHAPGRGWSFGRPRVLPLFSRLADGMRVGLSVPIAAGTF